MKMGRDDRYYERDDRRRDYSDEFNEQLHNRDNNMDTYRSRYSDRGNYYGMSDENAEYGNVRSRGRTDYGRSGPVVGSAGARGGSNSSDNEDRYHYGDPNPYMSNDRNGGYDRTRGTGWRNQNDYADGYSGYGGTGYSERDGYSRQDNSYQQGGRGRRFESFGRDEGRNYSYQQERTYNPEDSYNIGTDDSYYDRGNWDYDRSENDYRGKDPYRYSGHYKNRGNADDERDYRYEGRIQDRDQEENYATGLYSNNRSYVSDQDNEDSDRFRRDLRSGPDYSYRSPARDYGRGEYRG